MSAQARHPVDHLTGRLAMLVDQPCSMLAHRRQPGAVMQRRVERDLVGIVVTIEAIDVGGPCTWTFHYDLRLAADGSARKTAQCRRDGGAHPHGSTILPMPNLEGLAESMAREELGATVSIADLIASINGAAQ